MNFNILNSIPLVGHVKAAIHYANGDVTEGKKAMYEATRSTAVTCGGALGALGGPAGMAAMAVAAGTLTDSVASVATDTPEGVIAGLTGVVGDIVEGNNPTKSVLALGMCVSGDALGGMGVGKLTSSTVKAASAAGKNVTAEVLKTVVTHKSKAAMRTALIDTVGNVVNAATSKAKPDNTTQRNQNESNNSSTPKNNNSNDSNPKSHNPSDKTSSSGSDPPEEKQNIDKKEHYEENLTNMQAFLLIFGVNSLDDICVGRFDTHIFQNCQKESLKSLISRLRKNGDKYFSRIILIVVELFKKFDKQDVSFENFLHLVKFVETYVGEEVASLNEENRNSEAFEERKKILRLQVTDKIIKNISIIWNKYTSLKLDILDYWKQGEPTFKTEIAAVYHFYKHRLIPGQSRLLEAEEYFNLIKSMLEKLKTLPQYSELSNTDHTRREVVFERYMSLYVLRLKLVVKVQGTTIAVSSCYFCDGFNEDDKDGDEYVDGIKIEEKKEDEKEE